MSEESDMGELKRRIVAAMEPTEYELARRWIPASERLPEVDPETMLLVCVQCEDGGRSVDVARWRMDADGTPSWGDVCGSNQTIYGWSHLFVVAWMPLPEPPEVK